MTAGASAQKVRVSRFEGTRVPGIKEMFDNATFEKHYRIGELARIWGLGRETVRKLVKDDPGVIKIRMGRKRSHTVYSVPESAARRIHTRLQMGV
jgi:hypothetical protein